jgi:hypothetical protein
MNLDHLIERIAGLTREEEQWLRTLAKNGTDWQNYYQGEHTVIRKDKLALLNHNTQRLRELQGEKEAETPLYCHKCGTKLKQMPCDEELTYCPTCDLDHIY